MITNRRETMRWNTECVRVHFCAINRVCGDTPPSLITRSKHR